MPSRDPDVPTDRGWAWMIVVAFFFALFGQGGIGKSFGIFLEEFVDYFQVPVAIAALIGSVSGAVYTIVGPISVLAGEHFTQRRVVMFGGLIGGIGLCLSTFLINIKWMIFTYGAIFGFGHACLFGNGIVMVGQYFKKRRSVAMSLSMAGGSIGLFALPPLLQYLLDTYALRGTLLITGGIFLNQIVSGALYRPLTSYKRNNIHHREEQETFIELEKESITKTKPAIDMSGSKDEKTVGLENDQLDENTITTVSEDSLLEIQQPECMKDSVLGYDAASDKVRETRKLPAPESVHEPSRSKVKMFLQTMFDFKVLRNKVVLMFLVVTFLLFFGNMHFLIFLPPSASGKGISRYNKAWLVSINGIGDLVGRLSVGVVGDSNIIQRYKILSVTSGLCGISILCYSFTSTFWVMCVFVSLYGFFTGCYIANNTPTLIDLVGIELMAKVLALTMFTSGLGVTIGQPMLGAIRDVTGNYQLVNYINSACMVLGAILLYLYPVVKKMEDKRLGKKKKHIIVRAARV